MSVKPLLDSERPGATGPTGPASYGTLLDGLLSKHAEARCEKCFASLGGGSTSICKRCGWYASAGTFIEIDRDWESPEESPQASADAGRIPRWARIVIGTVIAVIIESVVARIVTSDGSFARSAWSGAQFALGVIGFFTCQVVGLALLMKRDSTAGLLDVILKPFRVSALLFRELPRRLWLVNAGLSGLVAVLAAVLIIGSVPYHVLWSWHVDYLSTQALKDAVALENAPGLNLGGEDDDRRRTTITCLIIGYELNDTGNLSTVLLAREDGGRLRYVGSVIPTGDPALLFEMRENLMAAHRRAPVMAMTFDSNWVTPKYACQISYALEQENGNLTDIRWEGDVRDLKLEGK